MTIKPPFSLRRLSSLVVALHLAGCVATPDSTDSSTPSLSSASPISSEGVSSTTAQSSEGGSSSSEQISSSVVSSIASVSYTHLTLPTIYSV